MSQQYEFEFTRQFKDVRSEPVILIINDKELKAMFENFIRSYCKNVCKEQSCKLCVLDDFRIGIAKMDSSSLAKCFSGIGVMVRSELGQDAPEKLKEMLKVKGKSVGGFYHARSLKDILRIIENAEG